MDDDSHDGVHPSQEHGPSKSLHLLRPFSWKHKQEPADSALLGDLNRTMRSSHDPRLMMPPAAQGGEGKTTADGRKPSTKPVGFRVKIRPYYGNSMIRVGDKALERIDEAAAGAEEDEHTAHASETKPNHAVRAPPTPPATAEPADERKATVRAHPPKQPVPFTGKVHAGDQEPGSSSTPPPRPSGKKRIRSTHHHQDQAPEPAGVGDEMEEAALRLGERAARTMDKKTLMSEIYRYYGFEALPKSQRLVTMQRRDADRPWFKFRLPEDQAKADVREVLLAPKRKRSPKNNN